MKISDNNIYIDRILLKDQADLDLFLYDVDRDDIPFVLVNNNQKPIYHSGTYLFRAGVRPFEMASEEQFNSLAISALTLAATRSGHIFRTFEEVRAYYRKQDLPIAHILIPKKMIPGKSLSKEMFMLLGGKQGCCKNVFPVAGLNHNFILILPEPEYLGVVAISREKYGIGIINGNAPVIIEV